MHALVDGEYSVGIGFSRCDFFLLTLCLVVAMEREKKGKEEGKRKRKEKDKKIIPFDVF